MHTRWFMAAFVLVSCASIPTSKRPAFPKFKVSDANRILLTGGGAGYLSQQGRCLGLAGPSGANFRTVIWPETANLSFDAEGLLLTDSASGAAVRLGDYISVGGGALPPGAAAPLASELTEAVPPECAASVATVNPGFKKAVAPQQRND